MTIGYQEDLALIHHLGFSTPSPPRARARRALLRRRLAPGSLVVDLGCGSGVWAAELTEAGYRVFGVDQSPAMVALAKKSAPRGTFVVGSVGELEIPHCQAITAFGEVFNYHFDGHSSLASLGRIFRRAYAALEPGGWFLFDVAGPGRVPGGSRRGYLEGEDWTILFGVSERRGRIRREITTFRRAGKLWRRSQELHEQRLYPRQAITKALRSAGFAVQRPPGPGPELPGTSEFLAGRR